jgi:pantoate--beta-alanine ligase
VLVAGFLKECKSKAFILEIASPQALKAKYNLKMTIFKHISDCVAAIDTAKNQNLSIGFVPTMGALHAGHISLINTAKAGNDVVVCSIFVNPTQFNDPKDFEKYPVTLDADINLLEENGCDILLLPGVNAIYPRGIQQLQHYALGYLETLLEGKYRPGHFQGVCQVVHRLLDIVKPHDLYIGQKDYQQCMVIKKLISITGIDTKVHVCTTLRETDGLAMSSRNMRLNTTERKQAVKISETLQFIKKEIGLGNTETLQQRAIDYLTTEGFRVDYVSIANAETLEPIINWDDSLPLVALAAAYLNEVRLIDNLPLYPA